MRRPAGLFFLLPLGLLPGAVSGCARQLPGPDECRAFALAAVGVPPGTPASALPPRSPLEARAEELTRQCLATPWDRPLLACLTRGGSERVCLTGFAQRRASGSADVE